MLQSLLILPTVILFGFVGAGMLWKYLDSRKWDVPFRDDHERAPGESLRLEIDKLNEQLLESMMFFLMAGVLPVLIWSFEIQNPTILVFTAFAVGVQVWYGLKFRKLIPKLRSYQIGFEGERLTAQYLQPLLCQGYLVFHDIPMEGYNVDHVVVGPNGVFAIETKSRRKRRSAGIERARVKYDGKTLQYPEQKPETWGIDAAIERAKGLQHWLGSAVGETISVQPILSLPGWYVERSGPRALPVMNPKSIPNFIGKYRTGQLSDIQIKRIRHQLGEKRSKH